jgi:putative ABC transport system ATP-binding protein
MIGVDSPGQHNPASELLPPIIRLDSLTFSWAAGQAILLDIEHLDIRAGEKLFIEGPSGSGKSTLLNLLAGVLVPQRGEVRILNQEMTTTSSANRDRFRADHIGVIFQMFNLIPYLSILENVTLPCRFSDRKLKKTTERGSGPSQEAMRLLSALNLVDPELLRRPVTDLSVGQQQRVAAARALIGAPDIVIADEPTSSLDAAHREAFIKLLFQECEQAGTTLVFVSHDGSLARFFDRSLALQTINRASKPLENMGVSAL